MSVLRTACLILVLFGLALSAPVSAAEYGLWVKVLRVDVYITGGGGKVYYIYPDRAWGFPSCASDSGYIIVGSNDSNIGAAAKDVLAVVLTAKVTGTMLTAVVDGCTTRNVIQLGVQ